MSANAMKAYTSMCSKDNFTTEVKGNKTSILIVYGAYDNKGLQQAATGAAFKNWYPNSSEHVCASGHYPMQETPVEYAKVVQDYFLK